MSVISKSVIKRDYHREFHTKFWLWPEVSTRDPIISLRALA